MDLSVISFIFSGINIKFGDGHVVWVAEQRVNLNTQLSSCSNVVKALVFEVGNIDWVSMCKILV